MKTLLRAAFFIFIVVQAHAEVPLFTNILTPLDITLEANFKLINTPNQTAADLGLNGLGNGMIDPIYFRSEGTLTYKMGNEEGMYPVDIQPRGMSRRNYCEYKPLKVLFGDIQKTGLFESIATKIDVVTHCYSSVAAATESVYNEYFTYRLIDSFGLPTYRVRLANITYKDTGKMFPDYTNVGIFLEPEKNFEQRLGIKVLKLPPELDALPITVDELEATYGFEKHGSFHQLKAAKRIRLYKYYLSLKARAQLSVHDYFLVKMTELLISHTDSNPRLLLNVFPIQYPAGPVNLIWYDFDNAEMRLVFSPNSLFEIVAGYCAEQLNLNMNQCMQLPTEVRAKMENEMLMTISEIIASFDKSMLVKELEGVAHFQESEVFKPKLMLSRAMTVRASLSQVIADPATHFAFLRTP